MGTEPGIPTIARQAADYLKHKYHKPGNVFIGVVSRLDSLVSGVLVLARTSKAASRLSAQLREQTVTKRYLALVEGQFRGGAEPWQTLTDQVAKNESRHCMEVVPSGYSGSQLARLRVRPIVVASGRSLVEVELETGRKHQIRLQLAHAGHAILGDRKYGSQRHFSPGIALHCVQLAFQHPTQATRLQFTAQPPDSWRDAAGMLERGWAMLKLEA